VWHLSSAINHRCISKNKDWHYGIESFSLPWFQSSLAPSPLLYEVAEQFWVKCVLACVCACMCVCVCVCVCVSLCRLLLFRIPQHMSPVLKYDWRLFTGLQLANGLITLFSAPSTYSLSPSCSALTSQAAVFLMPNKTLCFVHCFLCLQYRLQGHLSSLPWMSAQTSYSLLAV